MTWLWVAGWGGLVGVDATSFAQLMLSRPLVAAPVTAAFYGRPLEGLVLGMILELFALPILPIGAARYPESGTAAVAATAAYCASSPSGSPEALLIAVVFALGWERVTGASVTGIRRVNEWLVAAEPLGAGQLEGRHLLALGLDLVRGVAVVLLGGWIGMHAVRWAASVWTLGAGPALGALAVAGAALAGAALSLFGGWRERGLLFGFGVLCGLLILLAR